MKCSVHQQVRGVRVDGRAVDATEVQRVETADEENAATIGWVRNRRTGCAARSESTRE